jgi:hypothetical protein
LLALSRVMGAMGGHLDMYTNASAADLAAHGLVAPVVRRIGYLPTPADTAERVGETAHALVVPASFDPRARTEMTTLFPSKLADYTAMGLPILIWGPPYASATRWAGQSPGSAVVISENSPALVEAAIAEIVADPAHAARLAGAGIEAGARYFERDAARHVLWSALASATARTG